MPDQKLSQLTAATTPLTGAELVYVVQGGNQRRATAADVAGLGPATDLSYDATTRTLSSSTGADVVLPEATTTLAGLMAAASLVKLNSIIVDRAQLTVAEVRNNSGVAIPKGAPVYVTGSSGTVKTVALADASVEATAANTIGVALDAISHNSNGFIVTEGPLAGVDTSALIEGQMIWLSETTGAITTTRPTQPAHGVHLGWCVKQAAGSAGILYIKVDNGYELDELHDVLIVGATTGQVLRRAADGLWKNATLAAGDVGADAAGTAASSMSSHTGAADPHSQYALSSSLGTLATANAATPPALGGTTPAAGAFTALSASTSLLLPNGAPATPLSRMLYAVADTMRYRDSTNTERLLLNAADNLVNLSNTATARTNLGLGNSATRDVGTTAGTVAAGDDPRMAANLYAVGNWIAPVDAAYQAGSAIAINTITLIPFIVYRRCTVDTALVRVTTAVASSVFDLAIYSSNAGNPTGLPLSTVIGLAGSIATTVSGAVSLTLEPYTVYFFAVNSASALAFQSTTGSSSHFNSIVGTSIASVVTASATTVSWCLRVATAYGTWPDLTSVSATPIANLTFAVPFFRISALP